MSTDLSYCYLDNDFTGHRPANRELVQQFARGAVYSWPSTTTIHMEMMKLTRASAERAIEDALRYEENREEEQISIIENEALAEGQAHRVGCSHSRTGRCLCAYIAQWDDAGAKDTRPLKAFTDQMAAEGRVITIDTLPGRTSEWDGVFQDPAKLGPGVMVIPDEMWDDFDHTKLKVSGSPEFISASEYQARQDKAGATPFQSHLADVEAGPALQLPIVIATTAEDPAVIAEKIVKDNPQWFGELPAGTYQQQCTHPETCAVHNEALKKAAAAYKELQVKHLAVMKSDRRTIAGLFILSLVGWALAVARGIWGF